jgi:hypothetical protein
VEPDLSLDDAVRRWQALRERGRTAGVEDLCADCPEKTAYLSERLRAVASLAAFLGLTPEAIETQVETLGDDRTTQGPLEDPDTAHARFAAACGRQSWVHVSRSCVSLREAGWATSKWLTTRSWGGKSLSRRCNRALPTTL